MIKFFKEKIFFLINKKDKEFIRHRVMKSDHKIYTAVLIAIMVIEAIMLLLSLLNVGSASVINVENGYRFCYAFFIAACFICLILLSIFYKKDKPFPYYVFVAIFMFCTMLWGVGVSILASTENFSFLYFAICMVGCSAFICLEPWITGLSSILSSMIYITLYYTVDGVKRTDSGTLYSCILLIMIIVLVAFYFNFFRRINAIKLELEVSKLNELLEKQAYIDDLTKVYNRRYLTENIDSELNYGEKKTGLLMLDIDHFKDINDTYGHLVGDSCLRLLGNIILKSIKEEGDYCVRYGGEEFLIFFNQTTKDDLLDKAENLRKTIQNSIVQVKGGNNLSYTISIGCAIAENNISYNKLIKQADEALYRAKETRNTVSR